METAPQDWPDEAGMLPIERELAAAYNANQRHKDGEPEAAITAGQAYADVFDAPLPEAESSGTLDDVFACVQCGQPIADYEAENGHVYTINALLDISATLKEKGGPGDLCGPCLKALKEDLKKDDGTDNHAP